MGSYSLLPWLAATVRYDRVQPNANDSTATFAVISPALIFRTGWQAHDQVALQYSQEYTENVHSYVNNINTTEGGTHLSGFRTALTRSINKYGKDSGLFKDLVPTGEDFREGLTAVISCRARAVSAKPIAASCPARVPRGMLTPAP